METKEYKLVGVFNPFGTVPNILILVFKGEDNEYYYGYSDEKSWNDNKYYYTGFERLVAEDEKDIRMLSEINTTIENIQESYKVGDTVACGYETEKDTVYIGGLYSYYKFIKNYQQINNIDSQALKEAVEFIEGLVDQANEQSKKKIYTNNK